MKTLCIALSLAGALSACAFTPPQPPLPSGPRIPINQSPPPVFQVATDVIEEGS